MNLEIPKPQRLSEDNKIVMNLTEATSSLEYKVIITIV